MSHETGFALRLTASVLDETDDVPQELIQEKANCVAAMRAFSERLINFGKHPPEIPIQPWEETCA